MVHNPLPPPYQEMPHHEPPPPEHPPQPQAFENPAQYAGAGYHQPGFTNIMSCAFMSQAQRSPVRDYLKCSIFTTLFCCLPLGMAALIQSVIFASAPPEEWNDEKRPIIDNQFPPHYEDVPYQEPPPPGPPSQPQVFEYPAQYEGAGDDQQPGFMSQQPPAQLGLVSIQPTVYIAPAPLGNPVKDYMGYSIFTMLCCCLPLGIAALIHSINAREANFSGDRMGAERNSRTSKTLNHVALGIGLLILVLTIVYFVVMFNLMARY